MKKYEPLGNYLADLQSWETEVTLTFEQVEMIIDANLPARRSSIEGGGQINKQVLAHRIGIRQGSK